MQGCVQGSTPSPPAALGLLRTCVQGAAAAIVGPLGSLLARVRICLPSGPGRTAASLKNCLDSEMGTEDAHLFSIHWMSKVNRALNQAMMCLA
ncbi:hypothetical protein NDU88_003555 [Pleurodeles waltl]|uniref:Uncharacterized protein n=1 Tax=Pleurodeles waltl TaxID=8319 RepID=A0AAV7T556_PLEWA|nr:hypothetical protein NDU88_003555 [Pleurodeles waltl]